MQSLEAANAERPGKARTKQQAERSKNRRRGLLRIVARMFILYSPCRNFFPAPRFNSRPPSSSGVQPACRYPENARSAYTKFFLREIFFYKIFVRDDRLSSPSMPDQELIEIK
jgi:hypothetical protein